MSASCSAGSEDGCSAGGATCDAGGATGDGDTPGCRGTEGGGTTGGGGDVGLGGGDKGGLGGGSDGGAGGTHCGGGDVGGTGGIAGGCGCAGGDGSEGGGREGGGCGDGDRGGVVGACGSVDWSPRAVGRSERAISWQARIGISDLQLSGRGRIRDRSGTRGLIDVTLRNGRGFSGMGPRLRGGIGGGPRGRAPTRLHRHPPPCHRRRP